MHNIDDKHPTCSAFEPSRGPIYEFGATTRPNEPSVQGRIELKFYRSYPSLKPHVLFYSNVLAIRHALPAYPSHFEFDRVESFQGISLPATAHFVV